MKKMVREGEKKKKYHDSLKPQTMVSTFEQ